VTKITINQNTLQPKNVNSIPTQMQPPQPIPNSFFNQQQQNMMNGGGNAPSLTKKNTFGPAQGL
jgi:hypothetical protein